MKHRMKLKGRLKLYSQIAIAFGIVLGMLNVCIYMLNLQAGLIISAFLVLYFIVITILFYYNKPVIMNEFISFATQYGQIQRKLLKDLDLPHVLLDEKGKIIWMNTAFENIVHKDKHYRKSITSIFPAITIDKLPIELDKTELELSYEEHEYTVRMKHVSMQDVLDTSDIVDDSGYESFMIAV